MNLFYVSIKADLAAILANLIRQFKIRIMEPNADSWLKRSLLRIFINRSTTPPYLQIIQTCIEAILYLAIINGFSISSILIPNSTSKITVALVLKALLTIRLSKGLSLIRFVYIAFLSYSFTILNTSDPIYAIMFLFFLGIFIAIDILSNISFDFYSENLSSESLNICKVLHFIAFIFGVSSTLLSNSLVFDGIGAAIFIALWLVKRASICRSKMYKQFILRIYLWLAASHLMMMITNWITLPLLVQLGIPLLVSQLIMNIYIKRRGQIKLEELYSQQNYLKLAFELMIYVHGEIYNPLMDKQLQTFLPSCQSSSFKEFQKRKLIYEKIIQILSKHNSFREQLISAEIYLFYSHQLLKSRQILEKMKYQISGLNWMKKICLFRVNETLREIYYYKNKEIHFAHYKEYYACDEFRSLLLKSSITFVALWEYTRRPEMVTEKFRQLANRLVKIQRRLKHEFKKIETKCLTISLLYVSYLLQVGRDSIFANSILQSLAFNEDFEVNLQLDEKVFAQISLENDIIFEKVGHNISLLLGYEKKEVEGQKHDILVPQFFKKSHWGYINEIFEHQFSRFYLFNKKTIARNRWGYYQQCNVMFRLHFDLEGKLVLRGYLHLKPNSRYHWNYFLFMNENEEIIECSENLAELAPSLSKVHKASEIFEEVNFYKPLIHRAADSVVEYHPLLVLQAETQKVFYYARLNKEAENMESQQKLAQLLETMQLRKFQWQFVKKYYSKLQEVLSNIYSKQFLLFGILSLLLIGGLIVCQNVYIVNAQSQAVAEQQTMDLTKDILLFYNSTISLGMRINYVDMQLNYGYRNVISQNNVVNLAITLQQVNEQLKGLTQNTYSLPSLIPGVTYSKPNYDMIVELLSNSYMIRQFSDDLFIQNTVLTRVRLSIYSIFAGSIGEYESNFTLQIQNEDKDYTPYIVFALMMVFLLAICLIIVRLEYKLRVDENEALTLLSSIHNQEELISSTKQFISKITREEINFLRQEQQSTKHKHAVYNSSFTPDVTATAKDASRSEISLRQISGRDLLGDSLNRSGINMSGVLHTAQTTRQDQHQPSFVYQNQELSHTPKKRWMFMITGGLCIVIAGLLFGTQILYSINGKIDIYTSVTNVFSIFSTGTFFSRAMVIFMNLITNRLSGPVSTIPFDTFMANYIQQQTIVTFPEGIFTEFKPFQDMLSKIEYQYMCSYISCDPNYANQINIIYTTTMQKLIATAQVWKPQLNSMNNTALIASVKNGSLTTFINLVYYTESIIRDKLLNLAFLYFDCFTDYSNNLLFKKKMIMGIALGVTLISFFLLIGLIIYVVHQQNYLRDIANLVKTNSYINEDNQIADKQAGKATQ